MLREHVITPGLLEGHGQRRGRTLCADYVLVYRGRRLALIEAKAWDRPLTEGVARAKNYAGKLAARFAYTTNGQRVYGVDMRTGREGERAGWPTPDELWTLTFAEPDAWRDRFAAVPEGGGVRQARYYPQIAARRVLDAVADLGWPDEIGQLFAEFQRFLYQGRAAA